MTERRFFNLDVYYLQPPLFPYIEVKINERATYKEYIQFCRKNGYRPDSKDIFLQNIKPLIKVKKSKKIPQSIEIYLDETSDGFHRINEKALYKDFVKYLIRTSEAAYVNIKFIE